MHRLHNRVSNSNSGQNLAYAAFKWLVMEETVGFRLTDTEAFAILEKVARDRAAQLDAQIWTYQRALTSSRRIQEMAS